MRSLVVLLIIGLSLPSCRPAGDRADSSEALSEAGATGPGPRRGTGDPVVKEAENVVPPAENLSDAPKARPAVPLDEAEDVSENSPSTVSIPAQYRGRWGMVRADCEPGRSDAKGLMTVDARTLRFYESVGSLQEQRPAIATSFSGTFSFMGEGQQWERVVTLTRDGNKLTRADAEGRYTYTRC